MKNILLLEQRISNNHKYTLLYSFFFFIWTCSYTDLKNTQFSIYKIEKEKKNLAILYITNKLYGAYVRFTNTKGLYDLRYYFIKK